MLVLAGRADRGDAAASAAGLGAQPACSDLQLWHLTGVTALPARSTLGVQAGTPDFGGVGVWGLGNRVDFTFSRRFPTRSVISGSVGLGIPSVGRLTK